MTSEREAQFQAWWRASKYCQVAYGAYEQVARDAWQAALTREQRGGDPRKAALDELARENERLGLSYADAPQQEAPGAVAMWRAMTASGKWMYFDHEPTHMSNYQRLYTTPPAPVDVRVAAQALAARLRAIHDDPLYMAVWASAQNHGIDYRNGPKYDKELEALELALLSGQQAGVE